MDIDTPGETGIFHDDHQHLIWVPAFSKSFPLPFRVLALLGLGILGWATNLHLLRVLGVDSYVALIKNTSAARSEEDGYVASGGGTKREQERALTASVYRLFLLYTLWVGVGWCFFRIATGGEEGLINRFRAVPAILLATILLFLLSPYSFEKHTRESFLQGFRRCLLPVPSQPTYFCDIMLADIFTSFAKVFGDLYISAHQIFWVGYVTSVPAQKGMLQLIVPTMMSLPYFVRLRQCCIDYYVSDRRSKRPLYNALKYATAFPVIYLSSAQTIVVRDLIAEKGEARVLGTHWHGEHTLFRFWLLFVFINSIYTFWWDVTNDWGLSLFEPSLWLPILRGERPLSSLTYRSVSTGDPYDTPPYLPSDGPITHHRAYANRTPDPQVEGTPLPTPVTTGVRAQTENFYTYPNGSTSKLPRPPGLRPHLLYRYPRVYYAAIALNLLLRLTWSFKLSSHLHNVTEFGSGVFIMEALEIARRWMWVFFRVEWEVVRKAELENVGFGMAPETDEDYERSARDARVGKETVR
ncbi:EXS-domain-containing protein [Calocera viscosa TUFC12733]|uniref:EXS-domain-containing protein n=1 Tax=Calocera viscosa (strain TUFC12733) TaxID=1330018 RepID=A0A167IYT2_CALVF|nr:EXS-domain-containing protein [Calocera viscosa TUFC12733]